MLSSIGDDSITLHYQPLADADGRVAGMEALMRWHHAARGPISPEAFIPIFEESGLILPISRWAMGCACADAAKWRRPLTVAVNLSRVQFDSEDLPELVRQSLSASGLAPQRLELEVTESILAHDSETVLAILRQLRGLGIKVALAGLGSESFLQSQVKEFPFSKLKIARGVVTSLETSESARSIAHMIIDLGHSLNLPVAAEGVETHDQLAFLEQQGCDWMQGFLIGRPQPAAELATLTGNSEFAARPHPVLVPHVSRTG